jgi:hypothetical protein
MEVAQSKENAFEFRFTAALFQSLLIEVVQCFVQISHHASLVESKQI